MHVSQEDMQFIEFLSDNITPEDHHYEMPLPFKSTIPPVLPDNRKLAAIRLEHLKRKLKKDETYYEDYRSFMKEIINKRDADLAPEAGKEESMWYITHHRVYHPQKNQAEGRVRLLGQVCWCFTKRKVSE